MKEMIGGGLHCQAPELCLRSLEVVVLLQLSQWYFGQGQHYKSIEGIKEW